MNSHRIAKCLILYTFAFVSWLDNCVGETFYFDMMHRYSPEFRFEMEARNGHVVIDWPKEGSPEYYNRLIQHDRDSHRSRNLLGSTGAYSFAPSNYTIEFLDGLHYTTLELGTPNVSFLVALDTGSDLLWVPCKCRDCAPTDGSYYGLSSNISFSVYNPSNSKTSKSITCSDEMCDPTLSPYNCVNASQNCNYVVDYAQANTSTSGILVQDMLYLNSESVEGKVVSTPIYFGCGEVQTGPFLSGQSAPNGLLGLGLGKISIPSTLSRSGLVSNSFSICFSASGGSGRLAFGEKGMSDLQSTSLLSLQTVSTVYAVATTTAIVGDEALPLLHDFVFDTGSSYTLMPQASLESIGKILNKNIKLRPFSDSGLFDYCWNISNPKDLDAFIPLTLVFSGGTNMSITSPYIGVVDEKGTTLFVCFGVLPSSSIGSSSIGIIAHNFMLGYQFFFDRDNASVRWTPTNCSYPNGTSAVSPETSLTGMAPEVPPTPSTSSTSSATSPKTNEILAPSHSSGADSSSPRSTKFVVVNVFVFFICTIMIISYV